MRFYASIYVFSYVLLLLVTFILPFYSEPGVKFMETSLSELGAQETKGSWAMNTAISCMSLATLIYGSFSLKEQWLQLVVLYFFGVSFGMTVIYQMAGFDLLFHYNYSYDALHALFSILSGFAFVLLCISIFFKVNVITHKVQTAIALLIAIVFLLLQIQFPEYIGLFQRLLFLICFGWLFYALTMYNFDKRDRSYFSRRKPS